jgi:uncharacterized repeat protein (TIGR03803 family)
MRPTIVVSRLRVAALVLLFTIGTTAGSWAAATENVLFSFGSFPGNDGQYPEGGLVVDGVGNMYGTTSAGGDKGGFGTVYELSPSNGAWTETVLYSFCTACANGSSPIGSLAIDAEGNLYGTTYAGGSGCGGGGGCGTVFELSPGTEGWTETVLHTFSGSDGAYPIAGLVRDTAGNLYGTTPYGGSSKNCAFGSTTGCGVAFELSKNSGGTWAETVLHSFKGGTDGDTPSARLTLDGTGNLYGTTAGNAASDPGTVFKLVRTKAGKWNEAVLYRFAGAPDGNSPEADVVLDGTTSIYGTTRYGGTGNCSAYGYSGCGTVFELQLSGTTWSESVLHSFGAAKGGEDPAAGLVLNAKRDLYGTTAEGGNGCGTVFKLTPAAGGKWNEGLLHSFECSLSDGGFPLGDLILDGTGNIYGTTQEGGAYTYGTAFEVMP